MTLTDLLITQLADLFRIGLLVGLLLTTANTAAVTGRIIPLAAGAVFVAVLIPVTMGTDGVSMPKAIGVGLIANAIILAVLVIGRAVVLRLTGRAPR